MWTRPSWDDYFMEIAYQVARRSTCLRRQVGAVLVKDKEMLTTGYNGAPAGLSHCAEAGCIRSNEGVPSGEKHELCRGLHAEQNTIIQAASHGVNIKGATLYSTHQPCSLCAKMLINAGIKRIVYSGAYPDPMASELLAAAKVEMTSKGKMPGE